MKRNILLNCILLLSYAYIQAQEKPLSNELDKEYTPPPTSIFSNNKTDDNNNHVGGISQSKNILTFGLLTFSRGYYDFNYERAINKRLSVTAGFGKYIIRDYLFDLFADIYDMGIDESDINSKTILFSSNVISKGSYQYSLALKFFINKEDFDLRFFLELKAMMSTIHYKWDATLINASDYSFAGVPEIYMKAKHFSANFGWQWNSGKNKIKFSNELVLGCGLKSNTYPSFIKKELATTYGNNGMEDYYYVKDNKNIAEMKLLFTFGYKLGFGW